MVAYVREHMADYKRPRIVEFVDELPARPEREGPQAQAPGGIPRPERRRIGDLSLDNDLLTTILVDNIGS